MDQCVWRLLDTGLRSAAENITLDDVILTARAESSIPNTVRFLRFSPDAVLIGYHQALEHEVRTQYCFQNGVDINRRITGGGALLLNKEQLGWEIIATKDTLNLPRKNEDLCKEICSAVVLALKKMGIQASFRPKNDIEVGGRKIAGTGGINLGNAFLFQGTLLQRFDVEKMLRCLRVPVKKLSDKEISSVRERMTTIESELGTAPPFDEIKKMMVQGFQEKLGISLEKGELLQREVELFNQRLSFFSSSHWIHEVKRSADEACELFASRKTPGGLIRVALAVDARKKIIKSVLITGDFFAYPSRAIFDLEAALKNSPAKSEAVEEIVWKFFQNSRPEIPGIVPEDFTRTIHDALQKMTYRGYGFSIEESNHIFPVNTTLEKFLSNGYDTILLPYCAKPPICKFRNRDDCDLCGKCSVGDAYNMAIIFNIEAITILNYEHLEKILEKLAIRRCKGYIGCCCEPFYEKHQADFERCPVPAILIDIHQETCYDLGKEKEALIGNFENQTCLRLDLLKKIMRLSCQPNIVYLFEM